MIMFNVFFKKKQHFENICPKFFKKPHYSITNVTTTSINWSTTEPVYYNTSCSVHVPHSNLRPGLQELHMAVYPNLTNSTQDKKYGQTVVHKVTLGKHKFNQ